MSDESVRYMERTREYYRGLGYEKPYRWAHFDDIPFAPLRKRLAQCRLALVTTSDIAVASPDGSRNKHDPLALVGSVYSISSNTPIERLYSRNEHYDQHATNLDDVNSYCPITRLQELVAEGRVGSLAPNVHGVYTAYSQRVTMERDAPEVLRRCLDDRVDVALLTPV